MAIDMITRRHRVPTLVAEPKGVCALRELRGES